jgi:hypothetical protein
MLVRTGSGDKNGDFESLGGAGRAAHRGELLGQLLVADADPLVGRFWASPLDQEADNPEQAESGR